MESLAIPNSASQKRKAVLNRLLPEDRPAHDWFRFVLSFPPHLVRECLKRFGIGRNERVLDPFCGTGTTLVECKKLGIPSLGLEANPMAALASQVKTDWTPQPRGLRRAAEGIAEAAESTLAEEGLPSEVSPLFSSSTSAIRVKAAKPLLALPPERASLILKNSISPVPLHRTLRLLECLEARAAKRMQGHLKLALANAIVFAVSNLHFGPEVGIGKIKRDAPVVGEWLDRAVAMASDLELLQGAASVESRVLCVDARSAGALLEPESIDAVITSPPYPNEKDYTRTTRLESVILGLIRNKEELRMLKKGLVRSNTRSVYRQDDDDRFVADHPEIQRIAAAIESRRIELGKTSGFERLYHRVAKLYFGGMHRHLAGLRRALRPGANLAYVVGDQASYLRVMIRTGQLTAELAADLGYEVVGIHLFRTRLATATREQLREEVVLLRWPGTKRHGRGGSP